MNAASNRSGGPAVDRLRRRAGQFVAPEFREHITALYDKTLDNNHRIMLLETGALAELQQLREALAAIEHHMPAVLNAIASTNGTARLLRREVDGLRADSEQAIAVARAHEAAARQELIDTHIARLDAHVRDELWPLAARVGGLERSQDTIEWLLQRVETVRAEMMHELRYGQHAAGTGTPRAPGAPITPVSEIVNPAALHSSGGLRVNLGCGHIPLEGFVNVDMRKLPGVDVVAGVDDLPFEQGSLREIFSAHTLEHFPQEELQRRLLPYWSSLLAPDGTFRAVVPDIHAMVEAYAKGEISFENLRSVTYGGQEYEGDFHFNAFTPETLGEILTAAGFHDIEIIDRGRANGDCLEFEIAGRRSD